MGARVGSAAVFLIVLLGAAPSLAHPPSDSLSDAALVRATIHAAREAAETVRFASVAPGYAARLSLHVTRLELAADVEGKVPFRTLARMHGNAFDHPRSADQSAVLKAEFDSVKFYLNLDVDGAGNDLQDLYQAHAGEDQRRKLFDPLRVLRRRNHEAALDANQEALRRYELKYGPGSARLNLLEAALNHFAQRSSWFGPGKNGPGPLEILAAYSPTYGTIADEKPTAVSAAELGLRVYVFADRWGAESGLSSYLRPRFVSFGIAMAGETDGALRAPWGAGDRRIGPFATWGGIKAAYLFGTGNAESRFVLSRQTQLLPNLF